MRVHSYNVGELTKQLASLSGGTEDYVKSKLHLTYFEEYFQQLGAAAIVVEEEYIDHDFLDDYASYYVRCFSFGKKSCARLHFFRIGFAQTDLDALFQGQATTLTVRSLRKNYLGFVVVRPLPETMIGRTCLRTYLPLGRREFPCTRQVRASFCGIPLTVKTIPFQEQDTVAAACATSALWCAFQVTSEKFRHSLPTPVEITRVASRYGLMKNRTLPSRGLSGEQMSEAIRAIGLEPELVGSGSCDYLRGVIYGYLKDRIPVVMVALIVRRAIRGFEPLEQHAVTILGYSKGGGTHPFPHYGTVLASSRVEKVYAHDDQVGPFCRMEFAEDPIEVLGNGTATSSFHCSWGVPENNEYRMIPLYFLVPVYNKIRVSYDAILFRIADFDQQVHQMGSIGAFPATLPIEWDISLVELSSITRRWHQRKLPIINTKRQRELQKPRPRFIWRALARIQGRLAFDLLFDATSFERNDLLHSVVVYDEQLANFVSQIWQIPAFQVMVGSTPAKSIWENLASW